jgi:hypothetical protein
VASVIQRFEQRLESVVTGAFARAFRSAVQPVEIAAALQREVDNSAQVLSRDRMLAPNVFTVDLSSQDYERLAPFRDTLTVELARLVQEHVEAQRYTLSGEISIDFVEADDLGTGRFRVAGGTSASVVSPEGAAVSETASTESGIRRSDVVIEVNGMRHPVDAPGMVIGRGSEADLRINDPGISRKHAQITVSHREGTEVEVADLESTNGVILNGRRVTNAPVPDGSQLQLGNTHLVVHITEADRNLTDADV